MMWEAGYIEAWPRIQRAVALSVGAVWGKSGQWSEAGSEALSWQVFGYDFLIGGQGEPFLIEANLAPQLGDPQAMPDLREKLALPMINSLPSLVLQIANGSHGAVGNDHEWSKWDHVEVPACPTAQ